MPAIRKAIGKVLKTQTKDLGNGMVEVVVATNRKDRHGEILDIKGLNVKDYSGVVLWGHDYFSFPIGKSTSLKKTADGKLVSRAQFAIDEYDFAATAYKLIKNGYVTDASIGFIPKEWDAESETWTKSEMVEYSFVSIGANPDAKITNKALKDIGLTKSEFDEQVRQHMIKMKSLEDDEQILDQEEELEPEEIEEVQEEEQPEDTIDMESNTKHNVLNHIAAMKNLLTAAETELNEPDLPESEEETQEQTVKRKRIVLVRTKQTIKTVDRVAELAIGELKKGIRK